MAQRCWRGGAYWESESRTIGDGGILFAAIFGVDRQKNAGWKQFPGGNRLLSHSLLASASSRQLLLQWLGRILNRHFAYDIDMDQWKRGSRLGYARE